MRLRKGGFSQDSGKRRRADGGMTCEIGVDRWAFQPTYVHELCLCNSLSTIIKARQLASRAHPLTTNGESMKSTIRRSFALGGAWVAAVTMSAALLVACGAVPHAPAARATMSNNQEIFRFIEDITAFGLRRSGTESSIKTTDYIAAKFKEFGLQKVTIRKGDTLQWDAQTWGLKVAGTTIPSFYMRHSFSTGGEGKFSTGPGGLNAEFVYVGDLKDLSGIDVKGKFVVADVVLSNLDLAKYTGAAKLVYDPDKTLFGETRLDPFSPNNFPFNFASAVEGGAVGFIGILSNYFESNQFYNEDVGYLVDDDFMLSLPGLWVNHRDGAVLKKILTQTPNATGKLVLEGETKTVQYRTVIGHLPGKTAETLMVQSHHDSGFMGAVEDASGVAEVLALAKYYGSQPAGTRQRGMMFAVMDTHFTDYAAHDDIALNYIVRGGIDVVANVTVEHVAREMVVKNGQQVMTGQVDPRLFLTSPSLLDLMSEKVKKHDFRRSVVVSTELFTADSGLPTDVGTIHRHLHFPVISILSAPAYLYDAVDTLDKVAQDQLQPTAILAADLLDSLDTIPRDKLGRD
ncbi:M28 family peptidase [Cystobacter fuscus]|uniref:M28 family peptidase n=1 Tax=Cystobacter fuscus TaxID=43 RepID=UPI0037BE6B08